MRKRINIPGGLGIIGTEEYEENKKRQKAKSEDKVSEYLKFLENLKQPKNEGSN